MGAAWFWHLIKYSFIGINLLIGVLVSCAACIALAGIALYSEFLLIYCIVIICGAFLIIVIIVIGIAGLQLESRNLLILFTIMCLMVGLGESLTLTFYTDVYRDEACDSQEVRAQVAQDFLDLILAAGSWHIAEEYVDHIQKNLECCGVNATSDYAELHLPIPDSCIEEESHWELLYFNQGCAKPLYQLLLVYLEVVFYFGIASSVLHGLSVLLACIIQCLLRRDVSIHSRLSSDK